ncbi:S-adenosyl-L-methionine-dependent methyltransferase [Hygrophoropsis aurantiaca]|uniref:S-adenosyl-L-methionine-dependent methyltransferase n=1 Tax=Hygrophoropsis aurantiaca TaxID=72124 RepID=A0ACB8AF51_9AGAM|nr:S-adenosyl-L-methionine-dependent methyltransferase [Hygrophoropsis aurantiaca]
MNFYFETAQILDRLDAKEGSIKGILSTLPNQNRSRTTALVIETLKYKAVLTEVIKASKLLAEERKKITSQNLALVLVHDLILAKGIQAGDGPVKQAVLRHKARLHSEFQRMKIKRGVKSNVELADTAKIPRYVRVNTSQWTIGEAIASYISLGFDLSGPFPSNKGFAQDDHIPNLLLFNPDHQFHDDACYKSGKIILQDKASCFPAHILAPPASDRSVVIDATAAPGNKTSHLSALMQNKGKLFAFERDKKRFSTLNMMLARAACKNVETVNADFLTIEPTNPKYAATTHILLDPSCSGSGIVNRLDYLLEAENDESTDQERLNKLSVFQLKMIKHAMKFPRVQKIVYSTCSVHAAENEHVVCQALKSDEAQRNHFKLALKSQVLPSWHRRGLSEEVDIGVDSSSLIRCNPGEDATNGFFVSCFVRMDANDSIEDSSVKNKRKGKHTRDDEPRTSKKKKGNLNSDIRT